MINHDAMSAYGLWTLVIINSAVFIIFAYSFSKPQSPRDWRSFGGFSAFIVALFTEMYVRLALAEERDAQREFGEPWERYAAATPRLPHWGGTQAAAAHHSG